MMTEYYPKEYKYIKDGKEFFVFIACPLCGMNRIIYKMGTWAGRRPDKEPRRGEIIGEKGLIKFKFNLDTFDFVQLREIHGKTSLKDRLDYGLPPPGFYLIDSLNMKEAVKDKRFKQLIKEIYEQCKYIVDYIEKNKLLK